MTKRSASFFTDMAAQLAGFLIAGAALLCPSFLPAQIPDPPAIGIGINYYDLDGKAGFKLASRPEDSLFDGSFMEIYWQGSNTPYHTVEESLGYYEQRPASQWEHSSYTYRCVVPSVGVFEGTGRVTISESYASCLPVTSEAVGRTLGLPSWPIQRPGDVVPSQDCAFGLSPWVTNGYDYAGATASALALGLADHTSSLTVEYLPGNALEALGSSTVSGRIGTTGATSFYWGTYYPDNAAPSSLMRVVGGIAPVGPISTTT